MAWRLAGAAAGRSLGVLIGVLLPSWTVVGAATKPVHSFRKRHVSRQRLGPQVDSRPSAANCTWVSLTQPLSHFAPGAVAGATFQQRLCVYDAHWGGTAEGAPLFFYVGNESPLDEYVNNTGLMWEAARVFRALLVWAEHRYFGESVPQLEGKANCLAWLTSQEALADYAAVLQTFRTNTSWQWYAPRSSVVAFGGSYGGMLAAWFRMKYPTHVVGSIAASAPIWGFPHSAKEIDGSAAQLTRAASPPGGAAAACVPNLKAAWVLISDVSKTQRGRQLVSRAMGLCEPLATAQDAEALLHFLQDPLFNLAEGSYPFATDYITFATDNGTTVPLPPWPMRKLCEPLSGDLGVSLSGNVTAVRFKVHAGLATIAVDWDRTRNNGYNAQDLESGAVPRLLHAVAQGLQVWYNLTGSSRCLAWRRSQPAVLFTAAVGVGNGAGKGVAPICQKVGLSPELAWGALVCNDGMNLVNTAGHGFGRDLYWPPSHPRNVTLAEVVKGSLAYCDTYRDQGLYGLPEKLDEWANWMDIAYGGRSITAHRNIFFSNGDLDPWTAGGVLPPGPSPALPALLISQGGHHLDLFFATEADPPSVRAVRDAEQQHIAQWLSEASAPEGDASGLAYI